MKNISSKSNSERAEPRPVGLESWRLVARSFLSRIADTSPSRSPQLSEKLNDCIDRQFMTVQAICVGVKLTNQLRTIEQLMLELQNELRDFLASANLTLNHSCFGARTENRFDNRDLVGLWCLILEFATNATPGSVIELNVGVLVHGIELEIGGDCPRLENAQVLESAAFGFANRLMPVTQAINLKCPLGGGAIQLNIPRNRPQQSRVA